MRQSQRPKLPWPLSVLQSWAGSRNQPCIIIITSTGAQEVASLMTTVSATQMEWGLVEKLRRSFRFKSSYVYTCRSRRLPGEEGLQKGGGEREREKKLRGVEERERQRERGKKLHVFLFIFHRLLCSEPITLEGTIFGRRSSQNYNLACFVF